MLDNRPAPGVAGLFVLIYIFDEKQDI